MAPQKPKKPLKTPLEPAKKRWSRTPHPWSRNGECRDCDLLTSALTSLYKKQKETAIQVHSENKSYVALILNESKLSAEQRARLWHWRLGHCNPQTTVNMSKQGLVSGLDVRHVLNKDCTECDQAKFKKGTFKRAEALRRLRQGSITHHLTTNFTEMASEVKSRLVRRA